jgi:hypothetical protein
MFGSNLELPGNRMLSYDSALKKHQSIKPIRGRSDQNTRPLARRGNDNLTIRQDPSNSDIVVRLYQTDIIRYKSGGDGYNNLIELDPYPSVLTNRVMWSILGPHTNTHWSDRDYPLPNHITEVGGRYYNTPDYALIQPAETGWTLVGGEKPFEVPRLDRKEAKQALRDANFYTFQTWLNTLIRLNNDPRAESRGWGRPKPFEWSPSQAFQYLTAGEEGWREIAGRMKRGVDIKRELESLRLAVYRAELCYETETVPYFEDYRSLQNALNRMRRTE